MLTFGNFKILWKKNLRSSGEAKIKIIVFKDFKINATKGTNSCDGKPRYSFERFLKLSTSLMKNRE